MCETQTLRLSVRSLHNPKACSSCPPHTPIMSSLRRLAQTNHAISSPRTSESSAQASPSTPVKKNGYLPTPPRTRIVYPISPITSPSLSASTPFDWEAARTRKPPPYASPLGKRARAQRNGSPTRGVKRVVRKKSFIERFVLLA